MNTTTIPVPTAAIEQLGPRDGYMLAVVAHATTAGPVSHTLSDWSDLSGMSTDQVHRALQVLRDARLVADVIVRKQQHVKLTRAGTSILKQRREFATTNGACREIATTPAPIRDRASAHATHRSSLTDVREGLEQAEASSAGGVDADSTTRDGWERRVAAGKPRPVLGSGKTSFVALRRIVEQLIDAGHDHALIAEAIFRNDGAWTRNALLEQMRRVESGRSPAERVARAASGAGRTAIAANRDRLERLAKGDR